MSRSSIVLTLTAAILVACQAGPDASIAEALVKLLTDAYGFGVTNPPSTPTFVISTDGEVRAPWVRSGAERRGADRRATKS